MARRTECYAVSSGDYSSYTVHRVFLDQAAAEAFCKRENRSKNRYDLYEVQTLPLGGGRKPGPDGLPAKVTVWTYSGVIHVPDSAIEYHIAYEVAKRHEYINSPSSTLRGFAAEHGTHLLRTGDFTSVLKDPADRVKAARKYLLGKPKGSSQVMLADDEGALEVGVEIQDYEDSRYAAYAVARSLTSAEHARKIWQDARAEYLAGKAGIS